MQHCSTVQQLHLWHCSARGLGVWVGGLGSALLCSAAHQPVWCCSCMLWCCIALQCHNLWSTGGSSTWASMLLHALKPLMPMPQQHQCFKWQTNLCNTADRPNQPQQQHHLTVLAAPCPSCHSAVQKENQPVWWCCCIIVITEASQNHNNSQVQSMPQPQRRWHLLCCLTREQNNQPGCNVSSNIL